MKRKIIHTQDGSTTIHIPEWNEQYHSKHGALQEAYHVFIEMGFLYYLKTYSPSTISILEMGFGTGLNTFITLIEAGKTPISIDYTGLEAYPIASSEINQLNFASQLNTSEDVFKEMHTTPWENPIEITDKFTLTKHKQFFQDFSDPNSYQLIYFDAFGARVQPELWTIDIFRKMYDALKIKGVLVTYSAKGSVRRALQEVGFEVERLPGPPGKREMLRAIKN